MGMDKRGVGLVLTDLPPFIIVQSAYSYTFSISLMMASICGINAGISSFAVSQTISKSTSK